MAGAVIQSAFEALASAGDLAGLRGQQDAGDGCHAVVRHGAPGVHGNKRTSSPVTARPMSIRWISEVPSKMVKLSGLVIGD